MDLMACVQEHDYADFRDGTGSTGAFEPQSNSGCSREDASVKEQLNMVCEELANMKAERHIQHEVVLTFMKSRPATADTDVLALVQSEVEMAIAGVTARLEADIQRTLVSERAKVQAGISEEFNAKLDALRAQLETRLAVAETAVAEMGNDTSLERRCNALMHQRLPKLEDLAEALVTSKSALTEVRELSDTVGVLNVMRESLDTQQASVDVIRQRLDAGDKKQEMFADHVLAGFEGVLTSLTDIREASYRQEPWIPQAVPVLTTSMATQPAPLLSAAGSVVLSSDGKMTVNSSMALPRLSSKGAVDPAKATNSVVCGAIQALRQDMLSLKDDLEAIQAGPKRLSDPASMIVEPPLVNEFIEAATARKACSLHAPVTRSISLTRMPSTPSLPLKSPKIQSLGGHISPAPSPTMSLVQPMMFSEQQQAPPVVSSVVRAHRATSPAPSTLRPQHSKSQQSLYSSTSSNTLGTQQLSYTGRSVSISLSRTYPSPSPVRRGSLSAVPAVVSIVESETSPRSDSRASSATRRDGLDEASPGGESERTQLPAQPVKAQPVNSPAFAPRGRGAEAYPVVKSSRSGKPDPSPERVVQIQVQKHLKRPTGSVLQQASQGQSLMSFPGTPYGSVRTPLASTGFRAAR